MSERETRGRCLLVACFVGGVVLALFGLYRWPPQTVPHPVGGSFTKPARKLDRHVFIVDRSRFDVAVGLADYGASSALFILGVVSWYRACPRRRTRRGVIEIRMEDQLPVIFVPLSVIGAIVVSLMCAGAMASAIGA